MQVSITNQKDHVINVVVFSFGLYLSFLVLLHGRLSLGPSLRFRRDSLRFWSANRTFFYRCNDLDMCRFD